MILEQLGVFWANTEVVLDLLTKKGQHVEQFIGFATKPKLMARFKERIEEYKRFWEGVSMMASNYISGVSNNNGKGQTAGGSGGGSGDGSMHGSDSQYHGGGNSFSTNTQSMYGFLDATTAPPTGTSKNGSFGGGSESAFRSEITPPRGMNPAAQMNRYKNATPPVGGAGRVEEAGSFDSLGGVFKTVHSPTAF